MSMSISTVSIYIQGTKLLLKKKKKKNSINHVPFLFFCTWGGGLM